MGAMELLRMMLSVGLPLGVQTIPGTPSLCSAPHAQQHSQLHTFKFTCQTPGKEKTGQLPKCEIIRQHTPSEVLGLRERSI